MVNVLILFFTEINMELKKAILDARRFSIYILLILISFYFLSGVYSIPQNQIGVHQRFGKIINQNVNPGMHYALPWPIDRIDKVPVTVIKRILIDDFSDNYENKSTPYVFRQMTGLASCCISGDNNIVNIFCAVQYGISNPAKYLFSVKNNDKLLRDVFCNTIIKCLAKLSVDEMLTFGKKHIENTLKAEVQKKLNDLDCGLMISFVELRNVQPPVVVQGAFDDVINSKIDKRKIVSQDESYRNEKIPQAKATANKMIQQAQTYKIENISKAQGQTQRFLDQLRAYEKSEEITKKRLYLDFIKEIFPTIEKAYIIESADGKNPANIKIFSGK